MAFQNSGFGNVKINNSYSAIDPATFDSVEKIKVYFVDQEIKDLYDQVDNQPELDFEIISAEVPTEFNVSNTYGEVDILVVVESI